MTGSADRLVMATPDDYRVAARLAHRRNRLAVQARLAGDERGARNHQANADWLIARSRIWRNRWEATNG